MEDEALKGLECQRDVLYKKESEPEEFCFS